VEFWTCGWPPGMVSPPGLEGLLPRDGLSGVWGGLALLAGGGTAAAGEVELLLELFDPELELEFPPPHRAFVTRSITDVFPLDAAGVGVAPVGDAESPPPAPPLEPPDELLWWCFERSPSPLIRLDNSAEARSTTPCAEIDDMVCWNRFTLPPCQTVALEKVEPSSSVVLLVFHSLSVCAALILYIPFALCIADPFSPAISEVHL